jgi:hypothetical protein
MADTGSGITNGVFEVAEAGKRKHLPSVAELSGGEAQSCKTVTIQALGTNEGVVVVGGATVVAAPGVHAGATQSGVLLNPGDTISLDINDTAPIYLDVTKAKDGVSFVVLFA